MTAVLDPKRAPSPVKQAISGVSPPELAEVTVMTVRPSMARLPLGRFIGQLCLAGGRKQFFTPGKLFALLAIPIALALYLRGIGPLVSLRYRLTNRRLVVLRGLTGVLERWVSLEDYDSITIEVLPGQEWFPAGELIFRKGNVETFRLSGVRHPEAFRQACLKTRQAYVSVRKVMASQSR